MRDIGAPLSPFKSLKEVAELMAADGKQRPSKSGMQTCRGLPANLSGVQKASRVKSAAAAVKFSRVWRGEI